MTRRQASLLTLRSTILLALFGLVLAACQPLPAPPEDLPTTKPPQAAQPTATPDAVALATAEAALASPTPDCHQQGGTLVSGAIMSEALGDELIYDAYLPPCYGVDPDLRYPVVYLLHGLSYRQDQWVRLGLAATLDEMVAAGEIAPFIAIMPLESPFTPPQISQFGEALTADLIPWVDAHFLTKADKDYRAIGGVSRGAAWALRLGFENYELFTRVGAHSLPLFEADGGKLQVWMTLAGEDLPLFFIDIGRNDQEWQIAQVVADQLNENAIPHEWYLFNGDHTEAYWAEHLPDYLRWYAFDW